MTESTAVPVISNMLGARVSSPAAPKKAPPASAASLLRTLGRVTGLLSPQGDKYIGSVTEDVTDWTLARTTRLTSIFPTKRFTPLLFGSSTDCGGANSMGVIAGVGGNRGD